jgi:hypothetical protein
MPTDNSYRVLMDERWDLQDLYQFPHAFGQTYSFVYCFDTDLEPRKAERIDEALQDYPWNGGYSYVNIYTVLHHQVPPTDRPRINAIQYASPGWMDLLLNPDVALRIAKTVGIILGSVVATVEAFKRIDKLRLDIIRERRAKTVELTELGADQMKALNRLCDEAAKLLGFKSLDRLHKRTKNPATTLNLLMAHWRRVSQIVTYVQKGKIQLPESSGQHEDEQGADGNPH